jgi:hypothetical protein
MAARGGGCKRGGIASARAEQQTQARHAVERGQQIPRIVLGLDFRRRLFGRVAFPIIRIIHRKPVCLMLQPYHAARIFRFALKFSLTV